MKMHHGIEAAPHILDAHHFDDNLNLLLAATAVLPADLTRETNSCDLSWR